MTAAMQTRVPLSLLIRAFQISRMLRLVADLGIADRIPLNGQITVREIAAACSVQPVQLLRILRALAAFASSASPQTG